MIRNHPAMVRRRGRGSLGVDGAAAVELAIAAPVLILLVLGVADYGVLMGDIASLESAARAGAEVAKANPSVTAATLTSLGLFPSGATPNVESVCTCVDNTWPNGTACPPGPVANPCAGKTNPFIAGNPSDERVFEYVTVTATQNFSPIVSYSSFGNFPSPLTGRATIRIE